MADTAVAFGMAELPSSARVGSKRSLADLVEHLEDDGLAGTPGSPEAGGSPEPGAPSRPVVTRGRRTRRGPVGLRAGGVARDNIEAVEVATSLTNLANGPTALQARVVPSDSEWSGSTSDSSEGDIQGSSSSPSSAISPVRRSRRVQQIKDEENESVALLNGALTRAAEAATTEAEASPQQPARAPRPLVARPAPAFGKNNGSNSGRKGTKLVVLPVGGKSQGGVGQSKARLAPKAPSGRNPAFVTPAPATKNASRGGGNGNKVPKLTPRQTPNGEGAKSGGTGIAKPVGYGSAAGGSGLAGQLKVRYERIEGGGGGLRALSVADREAVASGVRVDEDGYPVTSYMSGMPDAWLTREELQGRLGQWRERYFSAERENAQRACDLVEVEMRNNRLAQQVGNLEEQLAVARQEVEDAGALAEAARQIPPPTVARHAYTTERPRSGAASSSPGELVGLMEDAHTRLLAAGFPNLLKKFLRSSVSGHIAPSKDSLWWNLVNDTCANLLQQHSNKYFFSLKVKQTIYCMNMLPTGRHAYNLLRGDAGGGVDSWDVSRANYNIPLPSPKTLMSFAAQNPRMAAEANEMAARHGGGADKGASGA
uniref:Uncharacterized protein n=1 Tax=Tetraselmis chuii TaxID=63592 RepID=A0A7S1SSL7_9CHLO|mmetsp:Transcript_26215/g.46627  ORF Transcript_26215/g.46627 Transcript_26215/m.46627 type:complete len:597 (+) Transcript_26215:586-2376(+)